MQLCSSIRTLNAHKDILLKLYSLTHYTILEKEVLEFQFTNTPGMRYTDIVPSHLKNVYRSPLRGLTLVIV